MNICQVKEYLSSPAVRGLGRAARTIVPFCAAAGVGIGLYNISPEFKEVADSTRVLFNTHPRINETLTSGIFFGFLPDLLAQRYEGGRFDWKRSLGMTGLGALSGGVFLRTFYDYLNDVFPGTGFVPTAKKLAADMLAYSPSYLTFYFATTNLIQKKPWDGFGKNLLTKLVRTQPVCWAYWIPVMSLVYNVPLDLRVVLVGFFNLMWASFLSNRAFEQKPVEESDL